jgi:hypothetical protein
MSHSNRSSTGTANGRRRDLVSTHLKTAGSADSIENRENNVHKIAKRFSDQPPSSPSGSSVRSGFSLRKRISSLSKRS